MCKNDYNMMDRIIFLDEHEFIGMFLLESNSL